MMRLLFFFSSRRRHTRFDCDWSSDVCSSDLDSWKELIALRNGLKNAGRDFFAFSDPVQHYLTATGRTLFKDLPFEELKRIQLEVLGNDEHIMGIALSDNSGWEELLIVDPKNAEESEHNAIKRLTALIKERDP